MNEAGCRANLSGLEGYSYLFYQRVLLQHVGETEEGENEQHAEQSLHLGE